METCPTCDGKGITLIQEWIEYAGAEHLAWSEIDVCPTCHGVGLVDSLQVIPFEF